MNQFLLGFRRALGLASWVLLAGCRSGEPAHSAAELRAVGPGHYATRPPAGESGSTDAAGHAVVPKVTRTFSQLPQTNDWWSSLIWPYATDAETRAYSANMYPHPLSARAEARGL